MFKIPNLLNRLKLPTIIAQDGLVSSAQIDNNIVRNTKNWYEERASKIKVQRNLLLVLVLILMLLVAVCVIAVTFIVSSKEFDPFVIQINDNTGAATIVNPITSEILNGNDALARYFIKKYLISRETYNPVDFKDGARQIVRLFSTNDIYNNFIGYIRNKDIDPTIKYAQGNTTFLVIKSWSMVEKNKYMVRYSINETSGSKTIYNKISVVNFQYVPMELTEQDRDANPVGFQINGYRVDNDNS